MKVLLLREIYNMNQHHQIYLIDCNKYYYIIYLLFNLFLYIQHFQYIIFDYFLIIFFYTFSMVNIKHLISFQFFLLLLNKQLYHQLKLFYFILVQNVT